MRALLEILWSFLNIGAFTFGGGYAMISLIREKALAFGWLTEEELLNMIAVSESTPGPIAVNMATYIGAEIAGFPGAILSTLGVVIPSFIIYRSDRSCINFLLSDFSSRSYPLGISSLRPLTACAARLFLFWRAFKATA